MDTSSYQHEASIVIDREAEDLYDLGADVSNMGRWSPVCTGGSYDDDGEWFTGSELLGLPGLVQTEALEVTDDGHVFILGFDSEWRPTVYEIGPSQTPPPVDPPPGGGPPPSGLPEPSTALLLGIAGAGAIGWRRLRR